MRERITISIKSELLQKIDQKIDGFRIRNRSHAIEHLVSQSLGIASIDNVVILGGGKGALKLVPIIDKSIKELKEYGASKIHLAVGYLGDKIKEYIGDGSKYGLQIEYLEGGEGTAGALLALNDQYKKSFLVVNLDEYFPLDLKKFINYHRQHLATATVATKNLESYTGYYLFEPEIFNFIPEGFSMLETEIFPKVIELEKLITYPITSTSIE